MDILDLDFENFEKRLKNTKRQPLTEKSGKFKMKLTKWTFWTWTLKTLKKKRGEDKMDILDLDFENFEKSLEEKHQLT